MVLNCYFYNSDGCGLLCDNALILKTIQHCKYMENNSELKHKLFSLSDWVNNLNFNDGLPRIEKDIILERLREIYTLASDISVCSDSMHNVPINHDNATTGNKTTNNDTENKSDNVTHSTIVQPIFASGDENDAVESIAEPVMIDSENTDYNELFGDDNVEKDSFPNENKEADTFDLTQPPPVTNEILKDTPSDIYPVKDEVTYEKIAGEDSPRPMKNDQSSMPSESVSDSIMDDKNTKPPETELSLFDYLSRNQVTQQQQTIGDRFGQEHENISERISQQTSSHKVSDLRTVININDKFSFVGTLFHNNMRAYTDFILRLNAIDNRDEAIEYISEVAQQYNWNMESIEVKTFNRILDRKF